VRRLPLSIRYGRRHTRGREPELEIISCSTCIFVARGCMSRLRFSRINRSTGSGTEHP
jgi:hypothetical protein